MLALEKYDSGNCSICTNYFSLLHWHHTVPQALGGEDSLQIPLCSDCHNVLHANGDALVAKVRSGKPITKNYWHRPGDRQRALPYLDVLVRSMLDPPINPEDKEYKTQLGVPANLHTGLKLLKAELQGINSLPNTILYCIAFTLKARGLYHDGNKNKDKTGSASIKKNNSGTKKPRAQLW